MKTTKQYPLTREECHDRINRCTQKHGRNDAVSTQFGFRKDSADPSSVIAFSFVESPRTPGAFREVSAC